MIIPLMKYPKKRRKDVEAWRYFLDVIHINATWTDKEFLKEESKPTVETFLQVDTKDSEIRTVLFTKLW